MVGSNTARARSNPLAMKAFMPGFISLLRERKSSGNFFLATRPSAVSEKVEVREFLVFLTMFPFRKGQNILIKRENLGIGKEI